MPGRNIAIECRAVFDSPNIAAVRLDPGEIEGLGGFIGTIEPDPGLPWWDGRHHNWSRRRNAARRDQQQSAHSKKPSSMNAVSCHLKEEDSDNLCLFRQERTACAASCRCSSGEDGGAGIIKIVKYGDG
jgi:hypothetical protein